MNRRTAITAALAATVLGTATGCTSSAPLIEEVPPVADTLLEEAHQAADSLYRALRWKGYFNQPVLIELPPLYRTGSGLTHTSRVAAEQVSARLASKRVPVVEVALKPGTPMGLREGVWYPSEELQAAQELYRSKIAVIGTYVEAGRHVILTFKAVDLSSGHVVAAASFTTPHLHPQFRPL